jgi:hypothetical protein
VYQDQPLPFVFVVVNSHLLQKGNMWWLTLKLAGVLLLVMAVHVPVLQKHDFSGQILLTTARDNQAQSQLSGH